MPIPFVSPIPVAPVPPVAIQAVPDALRAPLLRSRHGSDLIAAVAAIVALAAQRSAAAGELEALRSAVERALEPGIAEPAQDPREAGAPALPAIADADRAAEAQRLRDLSRRQQAR